MHKNDIPKAVALIFGAFCLIGFVVWTVIRSDRIEQNLFSELDAVTELDNQLCPFDGSSTRTSTVILFDFSDPLPIELSNYPDTLLQGMMDGLQDAERFDRFGLFTLNPFDRVPRNIGTFCIPVTMSQIPRDIRQTLWGTDPEQYSTLPPRYERFEEVFEYLWENDQELKETVEDVRTALVSELQREEQSFSRIIENIEEIAGLEVDRSSRRVNFIILSDMLQNSPAYSHYENGLNFNDYHSSRREEWLDMDHFSFEVYLVQSCYSMRTERRRALMQFWENYFDESDASVDFRLLDIDGRDCSAQESIAIEHSSQSEETTQVPNEVSQPQEAQSSQTPTNLNAQDSSVTVDSSISGSFQGRRLDEGPIEPLPELARHEELPIDTQAVATFDERNLPGSISSQPIVQEENPSASNESTFAQVECSAPTPSRLPPLGYPRNARGTALLRYTITVDAEGVPQEFEPGEFDVDISRYEGTFIRYAEDYIADLRFDTHTQEECVGGNVAQLGLRFEY